MRPLVYIFLLTFCCLGCRQSNVVVKHPQPGTTVIEHQSCGVPHGVTETWAGHLQSRQIFVMGQVVRAEYDRDGDGSFEEVWVEGDDLLMHIDNRD
jgi:hypothetical protein